MCLIDLKHYICLILLATVSHGQAPVSGVMKYPQETCEQRGRKNRSQWYHLSRKPETLDTKIEQLGALSDTFIRTMCKKFFISAYYSSAIISTLLHRLVIEINGNKVCESRFKAIQYHKPLINSSSLSFELLNQGAWVWFLPWLQAWWDLGRAGNLPVTQVLLV